MPGDAGLIRIALVEDQPLFAEAFDIVLTHAGHVVRRVSPRSSSVDRVAAEVLRQKPHVALLDLPLEPTDGAHLVCPLALAGVAVIVVTATTDPARHGECLHLGARAVVTKSAHLETVLSRIRDVGAGRPAVSHEQRTTLLTCYRNEQARDARSAALLQTLSPRESEVLGELMRGTSVVEIARAAFVAEATVRAQVRAIRVKLGVPSQLGAVGLAFRAGWRPPGPSHPWPASAHP
ncbi:response regulator transcription factor [Nocardioides sp. URHA0032]|uniref:response regulator transcription factor n=1 Tax=Nocardioides sp. URHA0032 TaxID=1380388 RepID=UPI00048AC31E|nr:response regulator transcription factor [Nocardioides sp. URHA0032]